MLFRGVKPFQMAFTKFVAINVAANGGFGNKTLHRFDSCFGVSVGLGVVRSADGVIDSPPLQKLSEFAGGKLGPTICANANWDACIHKEFAKCTDHLLGRGVISIFRYLDPAR